MKNEEQNRNEQTDINVRRALEEILHKPLYEKSWEFLVKKGYINDFYQNEITIRELAKEVREFQGAWSQKAADRGPTPRMLSLRDEKPSLDRVKALSLLIAKEAEKDKEVLAFRAVVLDGKLLFLEDVEEWIFEKARSDGAPTWWLTNIPIPRENIVYDRLARSTERGLTESKLALDIPTTPWSDNIHFRFLAYGVPQSPDLRETPTTFNGVLERLRLLSKRLSREYGWIEAESTLFVLTNEAPEISLMTDVYQPNSRFPALARIVLTVDPALSPREVAEKYSSIRQKVLKGRHREQSEKHLQLAIFVATRPELKTVAERMAEWNRRQPAKWKYQNKDTFSRDCRHARLRLLGSELEIEWNEAVQKIHLYE